MKRLVNIALAITVIQLAGCALPSRTVNTQRLAYSSGQAMPQPSQRPVEATTGDRPVVSVEAEVIRDGVSMGAVYFDFDEYVVKPEYLSLINEVSRAVRSSPQSRIRLEGHADRHGSTEYNLALGQRRAEAVRKLMFQDGLTETQMDAVSFGKEKPASTELTSEADSKNRRVEIKAMK